MDAEIWKPIVGFEGLYEVSNKGRVKSLERYKCKTKILGGGLNPSGYPMVLIRSDKISHSKVVHRLVALHFIPNPENKRTVNHINGVKTDNRASNLEWATYTENNVHALATGLRVMKSGVENKKCKKIEQRKIDGSLIKTYDSIKMASEETKVFKSNISFAAKGKLKSAGGYIWNYAN